MLANSILALGAFAISSVYAQSSNICEASPYRGLGCLASNTAAASECTSRLPPVVTTITSTTSVLSQITETPRVKTSVESQVTMNITNVETSTETVTCTSASTTYSPVIATTCETSVITTYTAPSGSTAAPTNQREKRQANNAACVSSGLDSLASFNNGTLSNACSCLNIAAPTSTSTVYITSYITATTTSYSGLAPTTTAEYISRATITVTVSPSLVTIPVTTTSTSTETSTISLAAPTYAPIWGPEAGCSNMNATSAEALPNDVTEECEADKHCQAICDQNPTCKFLYVQKLFGDYGGATPYFQCYMNNKDFDAERDLQCGRQEGIWGMARGYDACDRGVAPA